MGLASEASPTCSHLPTLPVRVILLGIAGKTPWDLESILMVRVCSVFTASLWSSSRACHICPSPSSMSSSTVVSRSPPLGRHFLGSWFYMAGWRTNISSSVSFLVMKPCRFLTSLNHFAVSKIFAEMTFLSPPHPPPRQAPPM